MTENKVGIYLHIPFCLSKCHYCDFCSVSHAENEKMDAYVLRLCREIADFKQIYGKELPKADTVYFGGGTPTILSVHQFERILESVDVSFGIDSVAEITAECNPKTADRQKLSDMHGLGINRLSIGMQSVHDNELRSLGRIHNFNDFEKTFSEARTVGFENISADLMYGIPEQSAESFRRSMETLTALSPEHISSYCLTIEEGTNFFRRQDKLNLPDEDAVSEMYAVMSELLPAKGYFKYEISNFAKTGRESRHNLKYWHLEDYIGFGAAAHSCFCHTRWGHSRDIDGYLAGQDIYEEAESLSYQTLMNEYVMLGMRLSEGVAFADFESRFGKSLLSFFPKLKNFAPEYVQINDCGCRFTSRGMFVSNFILSDILNFEN